ncbi:hypothetical protein HDC32_000865 [Pseudomonas sp. JAI120]|nr:hypothetical protein [Pseudomonas sp. SJZ073]MBB6311196.1 hypothetical protein [Pseudomonas sp. JAI120]
MTAAQLIEVLADPLLSGASPLPHFDRGWQVESGPAIDLESTAGPLWEMSSFSEASMTAAQLIEVLADPPLSGASPLPHFDRSWQVESGPAIYLESTAGPLWEMSSFSEASMAAAQLIEVLADPLLSGASRIVAPPLPHLIVVGR